MAGRLVAEEGSHYVRGETGRVRVRPAEYFLNETDEPVYLDSLMGKYVEVIGLVHSEAVGDYRSHGENYKFYGSSDWPVRITKAAEPVRARIDVSQEDEPEEEFMSPAQEDDQSRTSGQ